MFTFCAAAAPASATGHFLHRSVHTLPPVLLRLGGYEGVPAVPLVPPAPAGEAPPPLRPPVPPRLLSLTEHLTQQQQHGQHPGHHAHCISQSNTFTSHCFRKTQAVLVNVRILIFSSWLWQVSLTPALSDWDLAWHLLRSVLAELRNFQIRPGALRACA